MKQLYWIDDNFQQVSYIIQGALLKLWRLDNKETEGIASKIIICGNACEDADTDELPTLKERREAYNKIRLWFKEGCMFNDGPSDRDIYNAKIELVKDPIGYPYDDSEQNDLDEYRKMKSVWISGNLEAADPAHDTDYKNAKEYAGLLADRMGIPQGSVVGIDIALLYDDLKRLHDKKRILSMELFHLFSDGGSKCFLYSTDADNQELMKNWKDLYDSLYAGTSVEKSEIKIFKRSDFMQKPEVSFALGDRREAMEEIMKMFG